MKYIVKSYEHNQYEVPRVNVIIDNVEDVTVYEDQRLVIFEDNETNLIGCYDLDKVWVGRVDTIELAEKQEKGKK